LPTPYVTYTTGMPELKTYDINYVFVGYNKNNKRCTVYVLK